MLYSQGIRWKPSALPERAAGPSRLTRDAWRTFARHYHLFRGTPSRMWLDWVFGAVFGLEVRLDETTADEYFDTINARLAEPAFRPRALFERFNIEVLATTESPLDTLEHHAAIRAAGWKGRVITAFRPDPVVDPEFEGFVDNLRTLSDLTREDCFSYKGYLAALRKRRADFAAAGATSTDHGHPRATTADLSVEQAEKLFATVIIRSRDGGRCRPVPRAHVDGDGGHEPRRRTGHADPSGLVPQSQPAALSAFRSGQGRGYSDGDRLRACAASLADALWQ